MLPSATGPGIAAVLVTDQVGSTRFFVTHGEAEAARVTSEHGEALRRFPEPVEMRVGVAVGEVHHDGMGLRGWPFFHASRLCDAAADGTILGSRTLLDVAAGRIDQRLAALERVLRTDQEPATRSQLTATLAVESVFSGAPVEDLAALSQEAVDLARRSGDRAAPGPCAHPAPGRQLPDRQHRRPTRRDRGAAGADRRR